MANATNTRTTVIPENGDHKAEWPVIGGRARPSDRELIDLAAAKLNQRRGHFIIEAAVARAIDVLKRDASTALLIPAEYRR